MSNKDLFSAQVKDKLQDSQARTGLTVFAQAWNRLNKVLRMTYKELSESINYGVIEIIC